MKNTKRECPLFGRRKFLAAATIALTTTKLTGFSKKEMKSYESEIIKPTPTIWSSLQAATGWFNSHPLRASDLLGKVVVINFCTYSCINWLRTLPYLRRWSQQYNQETFLLVGIHTPEFAFEHEFTNVTEALKSFTINYPVALDNNYGIWDAFENHYWPALYFIDVKGYIRHHQFGEGGYEQSERTIEQLLGEAGVATVDRKNMSVTGVGIELPADLENLKSNENYLGHERTQNFASNPKMLVNKPRLYKMPMILGLNHWALDGDWTVKQHAALLNKRSGRIACKFHARDLHIVLSPSERGRPITFQVQLDGQAPGDSHGIDVDARGYGIVYEHRLYQLIRQSNLITDRLFEIGFFESGVSAFAFTFG